jgi:hypothetical protein
VHFIQAKLAWERPAEQRAGRAVSFGDSGWVTVELDGERRRLWNHEPPRLRAALEAASGKVVVTPRSLLYVPHPKGRSCFCVSTDGPTACQGQPPSGADPAERIRTHGGFLLSPETLRRLQERNHST